MTLLDAHGNPITYGRPRKGIPRVGPAFGQWAGRESSFLTLPGGGVMQFDLSRLTLADYRAMAQHYQLGASLSVLTFVMHQIQWRVECDREVIADVIDQDIRENWTPLIRAIAQSFWAGYSPIAVNYDNGDKYVKIDRFKDLVPEECRVTWKKHKGWAPSGKVGPTIYSYNGFTHNGYDIPPENSLWYPLLMENGDYYGRKLLKPAFPSWFFSNLIHLFANRYFERFGEPLPVGRAPFGDTLDLSNGSTIGAKEAMEQVITNLRSRSIAVLDSTRDSSGNYMYDVEYIESQMRGADFERYLSRLDEEMSLSVFTPVLLFRTADVGSYNLGTAHLRIFQQMLNAIAGDIQYYIQHYLVDRLKLLNWGENAPRARWMYRPQGLGDTEQYKLLMNELVRTGRAMPDLEELAGIVGLRWEDAEPLVVKPDAEPKSPAPDEGSGPGDGKETDMEMARLVLDEATARAVSEWKKNGTATLGFRKRFEDAMRAGGASPDRARAGADRLFGRVNGWIAGLSGVELEPAEFQSMLGRVLEVELREVR